MKKGPGRKEPRQQEAKKSEKEKKLGEGKSSPAPGLETFRAGQVWGMLRELASSALELVGTSAICSDHLLS